MARRAPQPPPLAAAECFLIDVLARTDELFAPYRWNGNPHAPGSIWTRRKRFQTEGIATGGADTDATGRKQRSRIIAQLTEAGLLAGHRPRARTRGIRLTPAADELLRSLCGLPGLQTSFARMARMVEIGRTDKAIAEYCYPATADRPGIREIYLLDPPCDRWGPREDTFDAIDTLASELAPALWRGFVGAHCDTKGRGLYMLTEEGREILADERADERAAMLNAPDKPKENDLAATLYWETRVAETKARTQWADAEAPNELGYCPLSCSLLTVGELRALREDQAECKRLDLHCPKCGGRLRSGILPRTAGATNRQVQCWRQECKHVFTIPAKAAT